MAWLEVERADGQFRIVTEGFHTQWLPDTQANRKTMILVLNLFMANERRSLFKDKDIAKIVPENHTRNVVMGHQAEFKKCGKDFLLTLIRKKVRDENVVNCIKEILCKAPLLSLDDIKNKVREEIGIDLARSTIDKLLEEVPYADIHASLEKQLKQGEIHYKENFVMQRLFELASSDGAINQDRCFIQAKPVEQACAPIVSHQVIEDSEDQDSEIKTLLESGSADENSLKTFWQSQLSWKLLAFTLYFHGISLSTIGGWFGGLNKSTICRWLDTIASAAKHHQISLPSLSSAIRIAVDEKFIRIAGKFWYLFAAVDCVTGYPIHVAIYPSTSTNYCQLFLLEIKRLGYLPQAIITDGHDPYIKAIANVFPDCRHLLCRFHVIKRIFYWFSAAKLHIPELEKITGKLFRTNYKRTVLRRIEKFKSLLPCEHKHLGERLENKLPQVLPAVGSTRLPSTSNAVESFFSAFDRFYKAKGPFVDLKSAQKHLNLFMLGYLYSIGQKAQPCPLEKAGLDVSSVPFYHLFNRPNLIQLRNRIRQQMAA